jgi:cell division protein FtsL
MAHLCPMSGCKEHKGMCKHEKMMLTTLLLVVAAIGVSFILL